MLAAHHIAVSNPQCGQRSQPSKSDSFTPQPPAPPADSRRLKALALAAPLITLVIALYGINPDAIGIWDDQVIYLHTAESLARDGSWRCDAFPGSPVVAKYPALYPLLLSLPMRMGRTTVTGTWGLQALHAIALALATYLFIASLAVPLKLPAWSLWVAISLLAVNGFMMFVFTGMMSESLWLPLLLGQVCVLMAMLHEAQPSRHAMLSFVLLAVAGCMTRSVNLIFIAGCGVALMFGRKWKLAGVIALGGTAALLINGMVKRVIINPSASVASLPEYYVGYGFHLGCYIDAFRDGGVGAMLARLAGVAEANVRLGLISLGELIIPAGDVLGATVGARSVLTGGALLVAAVTGLCMIRSMRVVTAGLAAYAIFFVVWTWPFSSRFWMPMLPLLIVGWIALAVRAGRAGRAVLIGLALSSALLHVTYMQDMVATRRELSVMVDGVDPQAPPHVAIALELRSLATEVSRARGDVVLGGEDAMWVGRKLKLPALPLLTLLDRRTFFATRFPDGRTDVVRKTIEQIGPAIAGIRSTLPDDARLLVVLTYPEYSMPHLATALEPLKDVGRVREIRTANAQAIRVFEVRVEAEAQALLGIE